MGYYDPKFERRTMGMAGGMESGLVVLYNKVYSLLVLRNWLILGDVISSGSDGYQMTK